jgi:hypothetical protein
MFVKYEVKDKEAFQPGSYPEVQSEVLIVCQHLNAMGGRYKAEIVISFLRDHSIRTEWFDSNDNVIKLVTSGFLKTNHIEALFNGCRNNRAFAVDFERYISSSFT